FFHLPSLVLHHEVELYGINTHRQRRVEQADKGMAPGDTLTETVDGFDRHDMRDTRPLLGQFDYGVLLQTHQVTHIGGETIVKDVVVANGGTQSRAALQGDREAVAPGAGITQGFLCDSRIWPVLGFNDITEAECRVDRPGWISLPVQQWPTGRGNL